ncbi:hypothetical protein FIU28_17030 [Tardiphaga sp. vice154]|uniref:hypothetical protein n=1 Tax=Tardiphaga sp. vice154 TaxID=2592814 RepID=UPI0011642045|nr:hypothetical protein [Tardiphaga sp. vice154]QDM22664.1 hypothetical protein FIU28_17030 [Tardiphaga sp. vice154]
MARTTRLQRAIDALIEEIKDKFEPAPERLSSVIPQRRLTEWRWSPTQLSIIGRAGWLHATGEILRVDRLQTWAVAEDGFYWLERVDKWRAVESLHELPAVDVDVGPVAGSTADLTDAEMEALLAARTPPEHDYPYDDDED